MITSVIVVTLFYIILYLLFKYKYSKVKDENKKYATAYGKLLSEENPRGFFKI